jgi:hypothetical protein
MPTYIVLGMHRSGTSAVAGMLDRLGVRMGPKNARPDWIGRHWSNPIGHFENPDIVRLNGMILGLDGTGVHDTPVWDRRSRPGGPLAAEIDRTLRASESDLWGWKDPWTVLTIDAYLPSLRDPRFIFVFRDPDQVARSLHRRDGTGPDEGRRIAGRFATALKEIPTQHPDVPRLELTYEEVMEHPAATVDRLVDFAKLHPTDEDRRAAAALVVDTRTLRALSRRLAREELATYPKWLAWLVAREVRLGRREVGAVWQNASRELRGAFRTAVGSLADAER